MVEPTLEECAFGGEATNGLIIACGALAREIIAVIEVNGLKGLRVECLSALLHNRPERIPDAVRAKIRAAKARGINSIHVAYGDCGTGGALDKVCAEEGVSRINGPHCYAFFEGNQAFAARGDEDMTSFYLTDFLARQFDAIVWKGLGLDRFPDLRDTYFGHYERVVYMAQTVDPELEAKARDAAAKMGLEFELRRTGYGELGDFIRQAAIGTDGQH